MQREAVEPVIVAGPADDMHLGAWRKGGSERAVRDAEARRFARRDERGVMSRAKPSRASLSSFAAADLPELVSSTARLPAALIASSAAIAPG